MSFSVTRMNTSGNASGNGNVCRNQVIIQKSMYRRNITVDVVDVLATCDYSIIYMSLIDGLNLKEFFSMFGSHPHRKEVINNISQKLSNAVSILLNEVSGWNATLSNIMVDTQGRVFIIDFKGCKQGKDNRTVSDISKILGEEKRSLSRIEDTSNGKLQKIVNSFLPSESYISMLTNSILSNCDGAVENEISTKEAAIPAIKHQLKEETVIESSLKDETVIKPSLKDETTDKPQLKDEKVIESSLKEETTDKPHLNIVNEPSLKDETVTISGVFSPLYHQNKENEIIATEQELEPLIGVNDNIETQKINIENSNNESSSMISKSNNNDIKSEYIIERRTSINTNLTEKRDIETKKESPKNENSIYSVLFSWFTPIKEKKM